MLRPRAASLVIGWLCLSGCGDSTAPSPFVAPDASDANAEPTDAAEAQAFDSAAVLEPDADPTLGGPCLDDGQCDDSIDCTNDSCDLTLSRCRFLPDDSRCTDDIYCDGQEVCDPKLGCREGEPISCSDDLPCTIDSCVEETKTCDHVPRDADGDGDPVWNCPGGGDCNDTDPRVSSHATEICGNGIDDDCDGVIDETNDCATSEHDTCLDPLLIPSSGKYTLSPLAAKSDYSASCAGSGGSWRDVVAAVVVPPGDPIDVDVVATSSQGSIAIAGAMTCGDASTELGCAQGVSPPNGGVLARVILRGLVAGNYPLYAFATNDQSITLDVEFRPAEAKPMNETCGTAQLITAGTHVTAPIVDATTDLESACPRTLGELVYSFELSAPQDVQLYAASIDGFGYPMLSLRDSNCAAISDEITCQTTATPHLFWRALGPGTYYVAVSASAPTDVDLLLELDPPSTPPADESCDAPPVLPQNRTIDVSLANHEDDLHLDCIVGAPDAAYALDLGVDSDVLLVERISDYDQGAVSLARPPCSSSADLIACGSSTRSPARTSSHDLLAGSYRAVVESYRAGSVELTAFVRPTTPSVLVAFADTCADAVEIPKTGGFFQGNTANATADYSAGCDLGGQPAGGAADQMLKLVLDAQKRVVLDMRGSSYQTLLDVRQGPTCPGTEVVQGCAAGYVQDLSYLDLTLPAGEYFVQIDGYAGGRGIWQLDAYVVDP